MYCRVLHNQTTQYRRKRDSYIPYITQPPKSPLPSSSALCISLFQWLDPNDHTSLQPAFTASPEGWRVRFTNCIRSYTGRAGEESPEGVVSRFGPGGSDKLIPAPLRRSDPDLKFSIAYRIISSIWMISFFFFSHPSAKFGTV